MEHTTHNCGFTNDVNGDGIAHMLC